MTDTKGPKSAGEHWVCSVLAQTGWAAALTRDGLERTDILAVQTGSVGRQAIEVQVKTASPSRRPNWPLGSKAQLPALSRHEWFALVVLQADPTVAPRTFIVPRDHVAAGAWIHHQDWLTDPTARPGKRNADASRAHVPVEVFERYENRWEFLGTPTDQVPVLLPRRLRELARDERVGLPEGHPWRLALPDWN
ncbi:hypothetical protein [Sinomonas sp. G460-2]|uniref:hypothetical protein n=1 Tax=Sinomonas sp. G460-2 TaxID=3393464 RepID=UPI0039EE9AD4